MKQEKINEEENHPFIYQIDGHFTIEELLTVSDILITDYSSIIFDYSLLNKPMAFFATDLDEYMEERDFYFDYQRTIPGPLFTHTETLINWINQDAFDLEEVSRFKDDYFDQADGATSRRIVQHIMMEE